MLVQSQAGVNRHKTIESWWHGFSPRLSPLFQLIERDQNIAARDLAAARSHLEKYYNYFERADYPEEATLIRKHLLLTFDNLLQSLIYQQQKDNFQSKVRYDIAKAEMDAVRFHLLEAGICA